MTIIVEKRSRSCFHAYIDGAPKLWASGESIEEAVGRIICFHGEPIDIHVGMPTDDAVVNHVRAQAARAGITVRQLMEMVNDDTLCDMARAKVAAEKVKQ